VTDFGRLSLVWTVVGVVSLLVDVRAWEAVTRYLSEFTARGERGRALATLELAVLVEAAVAILGFGLAWAVSGVVATRLLGDPSLEALIVLGAPGAAARAWGGGSCLGRRSRLGRQPAPGGRPPSGAAARAGDGRACLGRRSCLTGRPAPGQDQPRRPIRGQTSGLARTSGRSPRRIRSISPVTWSAA
jgi:hypothetical protein